MQQLTCDVYEIVLSAGRDIYSVKEALGPIYENFSLPSWLCNDYDVIILEEASVDGVKCYHISAKESSAVTSHDVNLWLFEADKKDYFITYFIQDQKTPFKRQNEVRVIFSAQQYQLKIKIIDTENVFDSYFTTSEAEMFIRQYQATRTILEYRYIEPLNRRTIEETQCDHFYLAFQGGGVKGLAYIGAYKALRDMQKDLNVKSIIGASAGAMIALAIAAGATPERLVSVFDEMNKLTEDLTVKSMDQITPQKIKIYDQSLAKIKRFLNDYGIMHEKTSELFGKSVLNPEVIDKLINYLCGDNESLKNMFSIEIEEVQKDDSWCCPSAPRVKRVKKLVNYFGFLEGKLMVGGELENICCDLILEFLNKCPKDNLSSIGGKYKHKSMKEVARKLTMKQFYNLTNQLELTVTAVDLQSQVLRFFNHKTTPDLPVCKAVRMSGSYPIAYQSQIWLKDWGKYYIHYDKARRELDLTGHPFTDGGMLANFPIIYLDNQHIRPLYFSHKPNSRTKMYGFGVDHIPQVSTVEEVQRDQKRKKDLGQAIYKHLPLLKFLAYQFWYTPSKPQEVPTKQLIPLKDVPFVGFVIDIINTYIEANDNFTKECFAKEIFFMNSDMSFAKLVSPRSQESMVANSIVIKESLVKIQSRLRDTQYSLDRVVEELERLRELLTKEVLQMNDLIKLKETITHYLKEFSVFSSVRRQVTKDKNHMSRAESEIDRLVFQFRDICKEAIFIKAESLALEQKKILNIVVRLIYLYSTDLGASQTQEKIKETYKRFFAYVKKKQISDIAEMVEFLDESLESLEKKERLKVYQRRHQVVKNMITLKGVLPNHGLLEFSQLHTILSESTSPIISMLKSFVDNRNGIKHYIRRMLTNRTSPNIHLVFQSRGAAVHTYLQIYKFVNEYLFMEENTKSNNMYSNIARRIIKSNQKLGCPTYKITTEDLVKFIVIRNDLIDFIAKNIRDFPSVIDLGYITYQISEDVMEKIKRKIEARKSDVNKITSITCSNVHSFLGFMIAAGITEERILVELQLLKDDFSIDADFIESEFRSLNWVVPTKARIKQFQELIWNQRFKIFDQLEKSVRKRELVQNLEKIREEFQESREVIYESFTDIIEYVVKTVDNTPSQQGIDQYIGQNLSIKLGGKDYASINQRLSTSTKQVMQMFLSRYYQQIKYFVMSYSSQDALQIMNMEPNPQKREFIWKGMIINNFLKSDKFRVHVQRILKDINLPRNIKMKQFYDTCPRHIELTFTAVELRSRKVVLINHNSYPYMPLWAAIVISSSFPILFPEVRGRQSWLRQVEKPQTRDIDLFFQKESQSKELPLFISGNLLGSLPLELLTNRKIQQLYFNSQDYTFLCFAFKECKRKYQQSKTLTRSFLTFGDIVKLGLRQSVNSLFGIQKMIEFGSNFITKQSMLDTFMWCHDNLILELYRDCVINLPVRFGTLDFHKLKEVDIDGRTLGESTIERAYYITKEKFFKRKAITVQVIYYEGVLYFHFLSRQCSLDGDVSARYTVEYRTSVLREYQPVSGYEIIVAPNQPQLFLKFNYVKTEPFRIMEKEYHIKLGHVFTNYITFQGIYNIFYTRIMNGLLVPLSTHTGELSHYMNEDSAFKIPIKSLVDINKHGLCCESCCSQLQVLTFGDNLSTQQCAKCSRLRTLKFRCPSKACGSQYCMVCCKNFAIRRTKGRLVCFKGHQFLFARQSKALFKQFDPRLRRCDICMDCSESCYEDQVCNIQICQSCCSEFILI